MTINSLWKILIIASQLRTFLVTALKRFMAKEWRHASAQKHGGGQVPLPLDTTFAESRYAADGKSQLAPDAVFNREWALTLLELTLQRLEAEFGVAGKAGQFAVLKSCLAAARRSIDYGDVAAKLSLSEGAARVAVHRLRKRFRELYREEITHTLPDQADVDAEMRHLAGVLARA
jgi:DNA-directed RNA polymerase specialized sigma24 family protein